MHYTAALAPAAALALNTSWRNRGDSHESHRAPRTESRRPGKNHRVLSDGIRVPEAETRKTRDHLSRHLTDGNLDFTLIKYDEGADSREATAAGAGPCIHHFAVEVDDVDKYAGELQKYGCEIISDPGVIPVKFRAPGGTIAEIVPAGRYKKPTSPRS